MNWERKVIKFLSNDKKTARLDADEYDVSHLDMDEYQFKDIVEVQIDKGRVIPIQFPPGMAPPPKPVPASIPDEKPDVPHIMMKGPNFLILSSPKKGEVKYTLTGKALQFFQKSFKEGDLVGFKVDTDMNITNLWKVDENGVYHKPEYNNGGHSPQRKVITIGGTVNINNNDNVKIEISGPYDTVADVQKLQAEFRDIVLLFGKDDLTKGYVEKYAGRVCGGQV